MPHLRKKLNIGETQMRYMVPYVDMMTTLCIFFLLLYGLFMAYKTDKETVEGKLMGSKVTASIESDPVLKDAAKVEVTKDAIKISLESSIMFGLGSAKLRLSTFAPLYKLAELFRSLPPEYGVFVEGNTDNEPVFYGGDYTSNWELSLYRALSLIQLFTEQGNTPDRFVAAGYSEYNPLYPNDTPEHQAENRRVEIVIRIRSRTAPALLPAIKEAPQPVPLDPTF